MNFGTIAVSVIVSCRNEVTHIGAFLESLRFQKQDNLDVEILIADGMSDDGTREIISRFQQMDSHPRVIDNPEKIVSAGLNRAIREAKGEIIVRMDVHTEYSCDYILNCVNTLNDTGAD